jgi:hypothetical protein
MTPAMFESGQPFAPSSLTAEIGALGQWGLVRVVPRPIASPTAYARTQNRPSSIN